MAIIFYKHTYKKYGIEIYRDTNILGNNVYYNNGQGCATIWFKNVNDCRSAFLLNGDISGRELADCTKCRCHYSIKNNDYNLYDEFICHNAKKKYAINYKTYTGEKK